MLAGDIKLYLDALPMTTVYHTRSQNTSPVAATLENIDRVSVGCVDWDLLRGPDSSYSAQDMASIEVWYDVLTDQQVLVYVKYHLGSYFLIFLKNLDHCRIPAQHHSEGEETISAYLQQKKNLGIKNQGTHISFRHTSNFFSHM